MGLALGLVPYCCCLEIISFEHRVLHFHFAQGPAIIQLVLLMDFDVLVQNGDNNTYHVISQQSHFKLLVSKFLSFTFVSFSDIILSHCAHMSPFHLFYRKKANSISYGKVKS